MDPLARPLRLLTPLLVPTILLATPARQGLQVDAGTSLQDSLRGGGDTMLVAQESEELARARGAASRLQLVTDTIQMMIVTWEEADAEGRELIRMLSMRYLDELEDLQDDLLGTLPDLDSTSVVVDSIVQFFRSHLILIGGLYDRGIDSYVAQTSALRERRMEAPVDESGELELEIRVAEGRLDSNLTGRLRALDASLTMGLDVTESFAEFDAFLRTRAESQAARLRMAVAERERIRARLRDAEQAGAADADIATLRAERQIIDQRVEGLIIGLRHSVSILERRDIDASDYRRAMVVSTGEVTGEVLDPDVAFGLLREFIARAWTWVRMSGATVLVRLAMLLLLIVVFRLGFRFGWWAVRKIGRVRMPRLLSDMVGRVLRPMATVTGLFVGLWTVGVDATALAAGVGVAGIIVGLALQDSMSNLAAGIFILLYRPYDREDVVAAGGIIGTVKEMGLANTTIVTFDNRRMYVPNRKIWGDVIENRSAEGARRVEFVARIDYQEDIDRAIQTIRTLLEDNERVLGHPEPSAFVSKLADSSMAITIHAWVRNDDWWPLTTELPRLVRQRFAREGIEIPYPHLKIVAPSAQASEVRDEKEPP